jgi:hypothetical protein
MKHHSSIARTTVWRRSKSANGLRKGSCSLSSPIVPSPPKSIARVEEDADDDIDIETKNTNNVSDPDEEDFEMGDSWDDIDVEVPPKFNTSNMNPKEEEYNRPLFTNSKLSFLVFMTLFLQFCVRLHLSDSDVDLLLELIQSLLPETNLCPKNSKTFNSFWDQFRKQYDKVYFCRKCENYSNDASPTCSCEKNEEEKEKQETDFFEKLRSVRIRITSCPDLFNLLSCHYPFHPDM